MPLQAHLANPIITGIKNAFHLREGGIYIWLHPSFPMGIDEAYNSLPQALSFAAVFVSLILLFYGFRNYFATQPQDTGRLLTYAIPSLWAMMLAIYIWVIGREDTHER